MNHKEQTAAERVAAYLDEHAKAKHCDAIHAFGGVDYVVPLTAPDLRALLAENAGLKANSGTMRAAFHTNMMRAYPNKSHAEITAEIDKVLSTIAPEPAAVPEGCDLRQWLSGVEDDLATSHHDAKRLFTRVRGYLQEAGLLDGATQRVSEPTQKELK